ncbi:MAG: hypothetical protein EOO03_11180 [Chitinophagaceae bacterium]|nr:MAG: hypothetical protein EOO03_11180 [Chitinophagaceae bacterium]
MKGQQAIYQSLFANESAVQTATLPLPERKGRSEVLKQKQNELIVARYFYYVKIQGRQYEATLEILQHEFFLAKRTIIDIVQKNQPQLRLLNMAKRDVKHFRQQYPFLNWEYHFQ